MNGLRAAIVLFAVGLLSPGEARADNPIGWTAPAKIGGDTAFLRVHAVSAEPDSAYVLFSDPDAAFARYDMLFARTSDGGMTWSEPIGLDPPGHSSPDGRLAATRTGLVYALTISDEFGGPLGLFVRRSVDRGATWSEDPIDVAGPVHYSLYGVRIASDEAGHVYVLFLDVSGAAWVALSRDFGASWRSPVRIEIGGLFVEVLLALVAPEDGVVHVVLGAYDAAHGEPTAWGVVSTDGGDTFSPSVRLDDGSLAAYADHFTADATGHATFAWFDDDRGLLARSSSNFGRSYEAPVVIDAAVPSGSAALASDHRGGVFVLYAPSRDAGDVRVRVCRSADYGETFDGPVVVSGTGSAIEIGVRSIHARDDGQLAAAWLETRGARRDVRANVSSDGGASWSIGPARLSNPGIAYDSEWPLASAMDEADNAYVFWGDADAVGNEGLFVAVGSKPVSLFAGSGFAMVPAAGGSPLVRFSLRNDSGAPIENVPVWLDMTGPAGGVTPPIVLPRTLARLVPGVALSRAKRSAISPRLGPGAWLVNLRVGPPVDDVASFCVVKMP